MSDDDTEQDWGSPEDWNAVVEWWRRSQHPNTYYVQPQLRAALRADRSRCPMTP